jgi:hypothetical protein
VPVRNRFYNFPAQPLAELNHPLLVTRWAKVAAFTRKSKQILMAAIPASYPGKTVFQNAPIQIAVYDLLNVGSQKTVLPCEPLIIDLLKCFKMVLNTLVIGRVLRITLAIWDLWHAAMYLLRLRAKPNASAKDMPILMISV